MRIVIDLITILIYKKVSLTTLKILKELIVINFLKRFLLTISVTSLSIAIVFADETVEEIVVKGKVLYSDQVKALKAPTAIIDVPQSLSIVTDEDIRKQGIREIGDIVRYTPGVNTSHGKY